MVAHKDIDILENTLRCKGDLLDILLIDRTTGKNLLWGTDSYKSQGKGFAPKDRIKPELVTGVYGKLIQPRAAKSRAEQQRRTKERAEVFTPLKIVNRINKKIDWASDNWLTHNDNWQEYVRENKLEISCGEAPFIVSRYNPVAHGAIIKLEKREGFLDRKLRVISHNCDKPKMWLSWAKIAFQSSYGYEWQGDNILIARENLLYTLIDYYKDKFGRQPSLAIQQEFAEIISWNIWQMDGIKYVVPKSCRHETIITKGKVSFFDGEEPDTIEDYECEGCKYNRPLKHNGKYVKIMDWEFNKPIRFVDLIQENAQIV